MVAPVNRRAPSFGLYLPQVHRDYRGLLEMVKAAEACDFAAVWFMDHLALPGVHAPVLEGWTLATAVAAATSRIRVGHLVLCNSFRHPVLLGRMAATLDQICEGRLNLGLGWGSSGAEIRSLYPAPAAEPPAVRSNKLRESVAIIRAALSGQAVDHEGSHFTVSAMAPGPAPVQERVPLFLGGAGPRTMPMVAELADWWNCPAMDRRRLAELAPHTGRARISVNYSIAFARRPAAATSSFVIAGPAGQIADAMCDDRELGTDHFVIQLTDPAAGPADLEHFMAKVAPAVR